MTGNPAGLTRPARMVPDEPDQVFRLQKFRARYPDVILGQGEFGTWQARIPHPSGETITIRYTLRELLDRLGELLAEDNAPPCRCPPVASPHGIVEDPALMEDLVPPAVPDPPHNPDPPR